MADDDYDDDDDEAYGPTPFPGTVKAAGIIWIGVGVLSFINMGVSIATFDQKNNPGGGGGACCAFFIAIAFFVCGTQTVKGTAKDTLGNGIGSLALGGLYLVLAVAMGFFGALGGAAKDNQLAVLLIVVAVISGAVGLTLTLAGVLALVGRSQYKEWRRENKPGRSTRRRRRRDEDEEYDD